MPDPKPGSVDEIPAGDRLMGRPSEEPLPTPLDPAGPESRGGTTDPKLVPRQGQGDPDGRRPAPGDIERTA